MPYWLSLDGSSLPPQAVNPSAKRKKPRQKRTSPRWFAGSAGCFVSCCTISGAPIQTVYHTWWRAVTHPKPPDGALGCKQTFIFRKFKKNHPKWHESGDKWGIVVYTHRESGGDYFLIYITKMACLRRDTRADRFI